MNSFIVVFAAALAVAHGGVITHSGLVAQTVVAPAVKSTLLQGPSASAHVVGSDGSQIVAHAPGASIHATEHVGVASEVISPVAYSAPIVAHAADQVVAAAAPVAYSAPVVAHAAPVVAHAAPVVAHAAPVVAHHAAPVVAAAAPVAYSAQVVAHAAPVVAHHAAPVVAHHTASVVAAAPVAYSSPIVGHAPVVAKTLVLSPVLPNGYPALAAGSGLEGQYVHDINEKLHDDGLYKGEIY